MKLNKREKNLLDFDLSLVHRMVVVVTAINTTEKIFRFCFVTVYLL